MKTCTKCKTVKDLSLFCKYHVTKDGLKSQCKICDKEHRKLKRKERSEYNKSWYEDNRECKISQNKEWRDKNVKRMVELNKRWAEENKGKRAANSARRRISKLQRTPLWSETEEISKLYQQCSEINKTKEGKFHVDHIIPLQGELVSGLHVLSNLQIIPAVENTRKSNKYEVV